MFFGRTVNKNSFSGAGNFNHRFQKQTVPDCAFRDPWGSRRVTVGKPLGSHRGTAGELQGAVSEPASTPLERHKKFAKIDTILKEVPFFKNLTRRRQHPC